MTIGILFLPLLLIFVYGWINRSRKSSLITDWPVVGMLPALFCNVHRLHEFATDVLNESDGTFQARGPLLGNLDYLVTSDPANVHYLLSKNFRNYPKGPEFRKVFDVLGDGIFNVDFDVWELHRRTTVSLFNHVKFHGLLEKTGRNKVEKGLFPFLDFVSRNGIVVDLQDVFQRFSFDGICSMLLEQDPNSLSIDLPWIPFERALVDAEEALLYRHMMPESVWKVQRWIGIGREKCLSKAWEVFDRFIYECLSKKFKENEGVKDEEFSLLTDFIKAYKGKTDNPKKFLRDTLLNLMMAGRDTTGAALTWFFWLLSKYPLVETKIRDEIDTMLSLKEGEQWRFFSIEELRKMVYLHGALCEALRLFPPVPFEHKAPVEPDVLPSGHPVAKNCKVILSFYSMGRMESVWGKDCLEFKPERWLSERGGIKHEPSYKFPAFNAGPRTCIGKEMAFTQMKLVATSIIYNYKVEVVEGQSIVPSNSIIMQMKYGLKAKVAKREV